jgi:hypothetical protein
VVRGPLVAMLVLCAELIVYYVTLLRYLCQCCLQIVTASRNLTHCNKRETELDYFTLGRKLRRTISRPDIRVKY